MTSQKTQPANVNIPQEISGASKRRQCAQNTHSATTCRQISVSRRVEGVCVKYKLVWFSVRWNYFVESLVTVLLYRQRVTRTQSVEFSTLLTLQFEVICENSLCTDET